MSLILDALHKSNREQSPYQETPSLNADHGNPHAEDKTLRNVLIAVVLVLTCAVILLLALLLTHFSGPKTPAPTAAKPAQTEAAAAPVTSAQPLTVEPTQPPQAESVEKPVIAEEVLALYSAESGDIQLQQSPPVSAARPLPEEDTDDLSSREQQALAQFLWEQTKTQSVPDHLQNPPQNPTAAEPSAELGTEQTPAAQEPAPISANSIEAREDVPYLHRLPVNFQNNIPSLIYADHNFENGAVIINKKRIYVGDYAAEGVAVEDIMEDGVVLSFKDRLFKLSALNSWVNY